jgi:phage tail-like protein
MTATRNSRYVQFNLLFFLGNTKYLAVIFQDVSRIGMEVTADDEGQPGEMIERVVTNVMKKKSHNVFLKQGIIDSRGLEQWRHNVLQGNKRGVRTVKVMRQDEDRTAFIQTWKLRYARIIKHTNGPFNAKGTDVSREELVLAYDPIVSGTRLSLERIGGNASMRLAGREVNHPRRSV